MYSNEKILLLKEITIIYIYKIKIYYCIIYDYQKKGPQTFKRLFK
jgi:hypothetical protein